MNFNELSARDKAILGLRLAGMKKTAALVDHLEQVPDHGALNADEIRGLARRFKEALAPVMVADLYTMPGVPPDMIPLGEAACRETGMGVFVDAIHAASGTTPQAAPGEGISAMLARMGVREGEAGGKPRIGFGDGSSTERESS